MPAAPWDESPVAAARIRASFDTAAVSFDCQGDALKQP